MPKNFNSVKRAPSAPYEVKVKPKFIEEINRVKLVDFYLTLASILQNYYSNGVIPSDFIDKARFIDTLSRSKEAHPQMIIDDDFIASIKTFNKKDSKFDVTCFDVLLESNLFAVPKLRMILSPTRSTKEICTLADTMFIPEYLMKILDPSFLKYEIERCEKKADYYNSLATFNTKDVESQLPVELRSQINLKEIELFNKKTIGNYYINHDHELMATNSFLVFLRQFFYVRLKVLFGKSVAKLFSSWIGCKDHLANHYSDKIEEGKNTTIYNDKHSDITRKRLVAFFHSTFSESHIVEIKKSWNDRRLRTRSSTKFFKDPYHLLAERNLDVTFELAKGLELMSFAESTFKLAVCLKDLIVSLESIKDDLDNGLGNAGDFKNILTNLRTDSVNVMFSRETTCNFVTYRRVFYDRLASYPLLPFSPYQFSIFFKTLDNFLTKHDGIMLFDKVVLKTTIEAYLLFISCLNAFMDIDKESKVDQSFKDMCDMEIGFISRLTIYELLGFSTQVVSDISKCLFEDYPISTSSTFKMDFLSLDPVMQHLFYFNILFRFPDLKHLIIE